MAKLGRGEVRTVDAKSTGSGLEPVCCLERNGCSTSTYFWRWINKVTVAGSALLIASIISDCSTLHDILLLNDRHANLEINLRFSRFHVSILLFFCGFYK